MIRKANKIIKEKKKNNKNYLSIIGDEDVFKKIFMTTKTQLKF